MFTGAWNFAVPIQAWKNGSEMDGEIGVDGSGSAGLARQIVPGEQPLSGRWIRASVFAKVSDSLLKAE
jgi:hypothetical protein